MAGRKGTPKAKAAPSKADPEPAKTTITKETEREKYESTWKKENYRHIAPAERDLQEFFKMVSMRMGWQVIDFGCGTGRAGIKLHQEGYSVLMLDIAENCLDEGVKEYIQGLNPWGMDCNFQTACLWDDDLIKFAPHKANIGHCVDVMEHLPEDKIDAVLENMAAMCEQVYLQIALFPHVMDGVELHLTLKPAEWWIKKVGQYFNVIDSESNAKHVRIYAG